MDKQQLGHRCLTNQDLQRDINRLPIDSCGLCRHRVCEYWSDKELDQRSDRRRYQLIFVNELQMVLSNEYHVMGGLGLEHSADNY